MAQPGRYAPGASETRLKAENKELKEDNKKLKTLSEWSLPAAALLARGSRVAEYILRVRRQTPG